MNNNEKWTKAAVTATLLTALATVMISIVTLFQLQVTKGSLEIYEQQLNISQRPHLIAYIAPAPDLAPEFNIDRAGKETEIWHLPYYMINLSDKSAYSLKYYHVTNQTEYLDIPNEDDIQSGLLQEKLSPGMSWKCGKDLLYRQQVIDWQKEGNRIYRHFYFSYKDEMENTYQFISSWVLSDYEVGKHPEWLQISDRRL